MSYILNLVNADEEGEVPLILCRDALNLRAVLRSICLRANDLSCFSFLNLSRLLFMNFFIDISLSTSMISSYNLC